MLTHEILLNAVAFKFPLGGISELTRNISASYAMSYDFFKNNPMIRDADIKAQVGNLRRAMINKNLVNLAEQYSHQISYNEKMEGEEGDNNHVELKIGNFLLTHHHQTNSRAMPSNFLHLPARYTQVNARLNEAAYFEKPWFSLQTEETSEYLFNLLLLHETSPEGLHQVGNIEFVFPKGRQKFITLGISELVRKQSEIMDLSEEDLLDFKLKIEKEVSTIVA